MADNTGSNKSEIALQKKTTPPEGVATAHGSDTDHVEAEGEKTAKDGDRAQS